MTETGPLADAVARQYAKFVYPKPIEDLAATRPESFYPALAFRKYWPRLRQPPAQLDILVAGCGTNQAALLAYHNRMARVTGIDISETSISHGKHLKQKHGLDNLEFLKLPIEEATSLGRPFDMIVSTGVLHHMRDPDVGARELAKLLRPDGVLLVMLYARYGYAGITALQSFSSLLGLGQDDRGLSILKDVLAALPAGHPLGRFLALDAELRTDGGLVDTFLHPRAATYTVEDCLALVKNAGLAFQAWFDNAVYYPEYWFGEGDALSAILKLPERDIWRAMEMFFQTNANHFFVACRADRKPDDYAIDFSDERAADRLMPQLASGIGIDGNRIVYQERQRYWTFDPGQIRMVQMADGGSTLRELVSKSGAAAIGTLQAECRFFEILWRIGVVSVGVR